MSSSENKRYNDKFVNKILFHTILLISICLWGSYTYANDAVVGFLLPMEVSASPSSVPNKVITDQPDQSDLKEVSEADTHREYYLKAAFLRFIAKFVKWPDNNKPDEEINVCIYGEVPSWKGINSINGRFIEKQTLNVRRITSLDDAKVPNFCHILYMSKLVKDQYNDIIESMKGTPVVTFGDLEGFAEAGGCMHFYIVNNRMAIMINTETMTANNLGLQPEVLKLITIIPRAQDINF